MKQVLLLACIALSTMAFTNLKDSWTNDDPHTHLGFTVTHLGINDVSGTFNDVDITLEASKADFSDASFTLVAKTASIDTEVDARNTHLKSADFLNVETYPTLNFKSNKMTKIKGDFYKLTGNLTMHGVTKPVTLELKFRGTTVNPMNQKETSGFQVTGTLKRSDFGIGPKFTEAIISDVVRLKADAEFVK
ncbi:YceI family protein [Formosa sp. S-31]|uniref:YceI family protein n=1 Tax=Formosa sp. S-31 TaxID=2790949 RepID=UPI003EBDC27F